MDGQQVELDQTIAEFVYRTKTSPAGAWVRACAFFVDAVPVGALSAALAAALRAALGVPAAAPSAVWASPAVGAVSFAFVFWLWGACWESSKFAATPGKLAFGLKVVASGGGMRMDFGRAATRSALKLLPSAKAALAAFATCGAAAWFGNDRSSGFLGPDWARPFVPLLPLAAALAFLVPNWSGTAWKHGRRYAHDRRCGTLVRAPLRAKWWSVAAQVAATALAAAAVLPRLGSAVRSAAERPALRTRGEVRSAVGRFFAPRFSRSPMRLASLGVEFPPETRICGGLFGGALAFATNCTGTATLTRSGASARVPFDAWLEDGAWRASFGDGASAAFRELLVEKERAKSASSGKGPAPNPEKTAPLRPGSRSASESGLEIRFADAELMKWPEETRPKAGPFLLALDFIVANRSGETRFAADWDARCTADGKPVRQVWLESFDPMQGELAPGGRLSGTLLFVLPKAPASVKADWLGLEFAADFPGRAPGMGK